MLSEDWDNLILLDACRYDRFAEVWDGPGRLEARESRGSSSNEFVRGNFRGREIHDTVCVTANGWYMKVDSTPKFHDLVHLFDHRDDELGTVPPETVTAHATDAAEEYPNKRLIVHYMQPHAPYIGEIGKEQMEDITSRKDISDAKRSGTYSEDAHQTAYHENLKAVVDSVESLLSELPGKSVISADHGEMLGERHFPIPVRDYMHPHGIDHEVLVQVPWLIHERGDRRQIVPEEPAGLEADPDESIINNHLRELGYLE